MATFNLANKIKIVNPVSNIDDDYGPYASVNDALLAIPNVLRAKGKTVGILVLGSVVEYWWKNGITDIDLIIKSSTLNNVGDGYIPLKVGNELNNSPIYVNGTQTYVNGTSFGNYPAKFNVNGWSIFRGARLDVTTNYDVTGEGSNIQLTNSNTNGGNPLNTYYGSAVLAVLKDNGWNSGGIFGDVLLSAEGGIGSGDTNLILKANKTINSKVVINSPLLTGTSALFSTNLTAANIIRSGGTAAQILAANGSVITAGTNITISGGTISASGGVTSFNGRTGAIIPTSGDYTKADIGLSNVQNVDATNASNLSSGTVPDARFPATLPALSGANLTSLNASNINTGTLNDARLSGNVALKNTDNNFSINQTITKNTPTLNLVSEAGKRTRLIKGETNNITELRTDVFEVGGTVSNGIQFTNTNSYIEANPSGITGITQWSFSIWVNRTSVDALSNFFYFGDGNNAYQISMCCGGFGYFSLRRNGTIIGYSDNPIPSTGWIHLVMTKNSSNAINLYLNGSLVNWYTNAGNSNISSFTKFVVGNPTGFPNATSVNAIAQAIDQLLLYNTTLNLSQVQEIYLSGTGTSSALPLTSNLILRYEFNEGTGNEVDDQSATGANGTFVNNFSWLIAGGKVPSEGTPQEGKIIEVIDGLLAGERGVYRFGDPFGGTIVRGRSVKFLTNNEANFSVIHNGNTLLSPTNTNTSATALSTVSVVGNMSLGSNSVAPVNGLIVSGETILTSIRTGFASTAVSLTLNATHNVLTLTANGLTATLPTAVGIAGRFYTIKLMSVGTGTIATTSSQTIDGVTTYTLSSQYKYITVQSDGANWIIIANN
jgi:hypothetical protein